MRAGLDQVTAFLPEMSKRDKVANKFWDMQAFKLEGAPILGLDVDNTKTRTDGVFSICKLNFALGVGVACKCLSIRDHMVQGTTIKISGVGAKVEMGLLEDVPSSQC